MPHSELRPRLDKGLFASPAATNIFAMADDVSTLAAALTHADSSVRLEAATKLSRWGNDARGAAVPLVRAVGDAEEEVRECATSALEELGPPSVDDLAALVQLLHS